MFDNHHPLATDLRELSDITDASVWDALRGARIFLTGGTGFFGRWLVESFLWANQHRALGASLTVLSRDPERFIAQAPHLAGEAALSFHRGDVRSFTAPEASFTHIIHGATEAGGMQRVNDRLHMADTIVLGTRRVLDLARTTQARMLMISSAAVYGRHQTSATPIPETSNAGPLITDPTIEYDEAKRMAEALCVLYHQAYGVPVAIARGFAFVGPFLPLDQHFAIGNFIRDALAGDRIHVRGDGSAVRSYLYASDLARWLWTMLVHAAPIRPYNLGSGQAVTIAELAHTVQRVVNPQVGVVISGTPVPGAPLSYHVPDITLAEHELGLLPSVSLEEAIRRTAAWHRAHPATTAMPPPASSASGIDAILAKPDAIVFDFDGVMTDNRVLVDQEAREAVFCNRSDGLGIGMLKARGVPMLVLSKEPNPVVAARCKKLGLECLQGVDDKAPVLAAWLAERGYNPARTIYVGNDLNDLGCLKLVGLPVAVADAYPQAKEAARLILTKPGGNGAVRELCDRVLDAQRSGGIA